MNTLAKQINDRLCANGVTGISTDEIMAIIAYHEAAKPCPNIVVTDGAKYCQLAESTVAALRVENKKLREQFPLICAALGNGAFCTPEVSLSFLCEVAAEVKSVVNRLRAEIVSWPGLYKGVEKERDALRGRITELEGIISDTGKALHLAPNAELPHNIRAEASCFYKRFLGEQDYSRSLIKEGQTKDAEITRLQNALAFADSEVVLRGDERTTLRARVAELVTQNESAWANRHRFCEEINIIGKEIIGPRIDAFKCDSCAPDAVTRETRNLVEKLEAQRDALITAGTDIDTALSSIRLTVGLSGAELAHVTKLGLAWDAAVSGAPADRPVVRRRNAAHQNNCALFDHGPRYCNCGFTGIHDQQCDSLDVGPDNIVKPCNCYVSTVRNTPGDDATMTGGGS